MSRRFLYITAATLCMAAFNNCGGPQSYEPLTESNGPAHAPAAPVQAKVEETGYRYAKSPLLDEALICKRMTEAYGSPYVPVIIDDKVECFAQHSIQNYLESVPAYRNYEYFYVYPPYTGEGCATPIDLGFDGILSVCLYELKGF